jgi:hypothetical protein
LKKDADLNTQDHHGLTPLTCTTTGAPGPGTAKFLLNWPATDDNITTRSGEPFLARLREIIEYFSERVAVPDKPDRMQTDSCSGSGVKSKRFAIHLVAILLV